MHEFCVMFAECSLADFEPKGIILFARNANYKLILRPLVATKFETDYARRAFPCFDEPALKAKFTLHISRDPTHQTLSNMPRDREERKSVDLVIDHYVTSPPMSTYTLAFIVHDFKYQETTSTSGVKVNQNMIFSYTYYNIKQ